jgi:hypothetical protein
MTAIEPPAKGVSGSAELSFTAPGAEKVQSTCHAWMAVPAGILRHTWHNLAQTRPQRDEPQSMQSTVCAWLGANAPCAVPTAPVLTGCAVAVLACPQASLLATAARAVEPLATRNAAHIRAVVRKAACVQVAGLLALAPVRQGLTSRVRLALARVLVALTRISVHRSAPLAGFPALRVTDPPTGERHEQAQRDETDPDGIRDTGGEAHRLRRSTKQEVRRALVVVLRTVSHRALGAPLRPRAPT